MDFVTLTLELNGDQTAARPMEESEVTTEMQSIIKSNTRQEYVRIIQPPSQSSLPGLRRASIYLKPIQFQIRYKHAIVFQILLFVGTVIGNVILLLAVIKSKMSQQSRTRYFITHLAIADLCVAVFSVLTDIIWKITGQWYAGQVMCLLIRYVQGVVTYSATYILVAISLDRLDAIARPMRFSGAYDRAKILISLAWASALVFSLPMLFINHYIVEKDGSTSCRIQLGSRRNWQIYLSLISAAVFIIPAFIIIVCYIVIIYVIGRRSKTGFDYSLKMKGFIRLPKWKQSSDENGPEAKVQTRARRSTSCSSASAGVIPQAKIRSVKMTFVIVLVFIFCWSPYFVFDLLHVYKLLPSVDLSVSAFIQSLTTLNSFANPFIYGIFSSNVCRNLASDKPRNIQMSHTAQY